MKKIKRALISVYDKKKLKNLLKILKKNRVQILSSGGTYKEIKKLGFKKPLFQKTVFLKTRFFFQKPSFSKTCFFETPVF